jgi:tyrosine-protein kinase Etk/Wzc
MNTPQSPSNYQQQAYFISDEDDNINFKRYLSLFISNWYWFAFALFITISIAYFKNRYSEKIYTVSSTLLIKDDQVASKNSSLENLIPGGDIFKSQQNLKNEMGILKSMVLNYTVIKELEDFNIIYVSVGKRGIAETRIYHDCPFIVKHDSLSYQTFGKKVHINILSEEKLSVEIKGKTDFTREIQFGERFNYEGFDFVVEPRNINSKVFNENGSNRYYFWFEEPGSLANQFRNSLSIAPIEEDASLLTLSISGLVPQQEIEYLNKLMEVYINYGLEIKNETAAKTITFIDGQLLVISESLSKAEDNLEKFRLTNRFFDLSSEGIRIQNRLENIENRKITLEMQLQYYNYLSEYLDTKEIKESIISPSVMGITDPVLLRLLNDLSVLRKEKEMIGFNLVVDQPLLELNKKQIEETREALQDNIKNAIESLHSSIAEEDKKLTVIENEINKLPTTEKNLVGIQRKFDLNNTVYTYLLEKRAEAGIAKASNVSDNRIIDRASQLSTIIIKPKTRKNLTVAFMLGLILPIILILLIDYFNDKIIDKSDIEKKTKTPVIGYISHNEIKSEIPVIEKPGSAFSESFRSVRTAIKYFIKENENPVIAVSSTISSEGKTFVAINLASIIALLGKKVLLIGLDLRKPRLNKAFIFEDSPGMSNFLCGNCKYEDVIRSTQVENLFYAPSGPIPPNPAELLEHEEMKVFIEKAKMEFDYIIIDTPPVAIVTDTLLLARYVDLNLFIVRQRYTSRSTIEIVEHLYQQKELKNMALIINDISLSGYYGYGLRYGYGHGYGYYYGHNYYGHEYYGRYRDPAKSSYYTEDKQV